MPSRPSSSVASSCRSARSPTRKIGGSVVTSISRSGLRGSAQTVLRPMVASYGMVSPWDGSGDDDGAKVGPAAEVAAEEHPGVVDHLVQAGVLRRPAQFQPGPFGRRDQNRYIPVTA